MTTADAMPPGTENAVERLRSRAVAALPFLGAQFPEARFHAALARAVAARFRGEKPSPGERLRFLESLHAEDLALACACAEGREAAWEYFIATFRVQLYAAARAVTHGEESRARELADSIYADLFGMGERSAEGEGGEPQRRSLFDYFHGRSRLATWLRAVLAQRFVDQMRAAKRTVSLDVSGDPGLDALPEPAAPPPPDPERTRYAAILQTALAAALSALEPRDRLRLAYYYVQDLTLAQIGRLMGEHEATVSRKLDRLRAGLRQRVERALREEQRMSAAQIALCFESSGDPGAFDLEAALAAEPAKKETRR